MIDTTDRFQKSLQKLGDLQNMLKSNNQSKVLTFEV